MALTTIEVIDGLKALLTEKHLELATVQGDITTTEQKLKDLKARETALIDMLNSGNPFVALFG